MQMRDLPLSETITAMVQPLLQNQIPVFFAMCDFVCCVELKEGFDNIRDAITEKADELGVAVDPKVLDALFAIDQKRVRIEAVIGDSAEMSLKGRLSGHGFQPHPTD